MKSKEFGRKRRVFLDYVNYKNEPHTYIVIPKGMRFGKSRYYPQRPAHWLLKCWVYKKIPFKSRTFIGISAPVIREFAVGKILGWKELA